MIVTLAEQIRPLWEAGKSAAEIAETFGISEKFIHVIAKKNFKKRKEIMSSRDANIMADRVNMTQAELAKKYKLSHQRIYQIVHKFAPGSNTRSKACSFCLARVTPLTRGIAGNKSAICADCVERIHVANNPDGLGERGA